jgi:hypothetical protein
MVGEEDKSPGFSRLSVAMEQPQESFCEEILWQLPQGLTWSHG